jgi:hypothetical protein
MMKSYPVAKTIKESNMKTILITLLAFTVMDIGLRKQQSVECAKVDTMPCPEASWWLADIL